MNSLDNIINAIGPTHEWAPWWKECRDELHNTEHDDLDGLYNLYRKMESSFGGMGTFNDYPHNEDVLITARLLCDDIALRLKDVWRRLGREHHPDGSFEPYALETQVHLVRGSVLMLDRQGRPDYAEFVTDHLYTIGGYGGTDITNMPIYHLTFKRSRRPARHAALRLST